MNYTFAAIRSEFRRSELDGLVLEHSTANAAVRQGDDLVQVSGQGGLSYHLSGGDEDETANDCRPEQSSFPGNRRSLARVSSRGTTASGATQGDDAG